MYNSFYRSSKAGDNNVENMEVPLQLNCIGKEIMDCMSASTERRDYYLFYLYDGIVNIKEPISATLKSGDMIIFDKHTHFEYYSDGQTKHYFAHFTGYFAETLLNQCNLKTKTVYELGRSDSIVAKFHNIFEAFFIRDEFFDIDITSKLSLLLVTFGRKNQKNEKPDMYKRLKILRRSLEYINENISKPIQLYELAEREFLSISRYHTLFKSVMNISPLNYITSLRINAACELLEKSNLTVSEIAKTVGFEDQRYFSRVFKKHKGMTPTEFRALS